MFNSNFLQPLFGALLLLVSVVVAAEKPTSNNNTLLLTDSAKECYCAGGDIEVYPYEVVPISQAGGGCIGGCGGSRFEFHNYGVNVKELKVWLGGENNGFSALYVQFFDGNVNIAGVIPARNPDASFVFNTGEIIIGTIEMHGNGIGTRVGRLAFKTSAGNSFSVGDAHTPYYFNSGNSFLTGFFGQSGNDIDQLGLLLMKPITTTRMMNVRYPTLNSYNQNLAPNVHKTYLCNDSPTIPQQTTATFQVETGKSYSFSYTNSLMIGASISVTAGVPEVVEFNSEFKWEVSSSSTMAVEEHSTETRTMEFPVVADARTIVEATFTWWDSKATVPYVTDIVFNFKDGTNLTLPDVSGIYDGMYISEVRSNFHHTPLADGESCNNST